MDRTGNLYGTTYYGTVFKLSHKGSGWVFNPLYTFQGGSDGASPWGSVVFGPDGTLYGTTYSGGGSGCYGRGCGTVYNLRPQPTACKTALCPWTETVLYRFSGGSDESNPQGEVVFDHAGNIYGVTDGGNGWNCYLPSNCGTVYTLTPSGGGWAESVLYTFTSTVIP